MEEYITYEEACFIAQSIKSDCIYYGHCILQDGELISPHSIIIDDEGIRIVHENTTHVLFVNDPEYDEGLYTTKTDWVNMCFKESRSFVKHVNIDDRLKQLL